MQDVDIAATAGSRFLDAATLLGSMDRNAVPIYDDEARRIDDARSWATSQLGHERYELAHAEGAERDIPAAASWALAALRAHDR